MTNATDADLAYIEQFTALEWLGLNSTGITDRGLQQHPLPPRIWELGLSDTQLTDEGLKAISHLTHLKSLDLNNTRITRASLPVIANFAELERLYIYGTKLNQDDVAWLQKKLPKCRILKIP